MNRKDGPMTAPGWIEKGLDECVAHEDDQVWGALLATSLLRNLPLDSIRAAVGFVLDQRIQDRAVLLDRIVSGVALALSGGLQSSASTEAKIDRVASERAAAREKYESDRTREPDLRDEYESDEERNLVAEIASAPPRAATVRRYAGLVADLMVVIDRGEVLDGELERLCDRAEACREIDVP